MAYFVTVNDVPYLKFQNLKILESWSFAAFMAYIFIYSFI